MSTRPPLAHPLTLPPPLAHTTCCSCLLDQPRLRSATAAYMCVCVCVCVACPNTQAACQSTSSHLQPPAATSSQPHPLQTHHYQHASMPIIAYAVASFGQLLAARAESLLRNSCSCYCVCCGPCSAPATASLPASLLLHLLWPCKSYSHWRSK